MTCEVAVANRVAIALAADSAVTFRDGSDRTTYASGANKIFQLAEADPVGVMVYNAASLSLVPWELVLKSYRRHLGRSHFPGLQGYWDDLVTFINERSGLLIPASVRASATESACRDGVLYVLNRALLARAPLRDRATPPADLPTLSNEALDDIEGDLRGPVSERLREHDLDQIFGSPLPSSLATEVPPFLRGHYPHLETAVDADRLARLGITAAFKHPERVLSNFTGVVLAGYGSDDYLPGYINVRVHGFVGSRLFWDSMQAEAINYAETPSLIQAFAQKAMVETFTQGTSPEVWGSVREAFQTHAAEACRSALAAAGASVDEAVVHQTVANELAKFTRSWAFDVLRAHFAPLRTVIASLSVEELAELAETMVVLESLKEKVTSRTQGVGGPIDVAVITKTEGLVWVKRKHYFDPKLNQRYFVRLQQTA